MNRTIISLGALLAALAIFIAANLVATQPLRAAKADLTEGRLYTLSQGSRNIAHSLKEPARLTLYYSEKAGNDVPQFKSYAARVKEILREYADSSGGKIDLKFADPEPFSDSEDTAVQAGLVGVPTGRGQDRFYFGLVGRNSTDKQEIIPFFQPQKEEFLEYDLTRLVYLLSDAPKKTVGLMSWLPLEGQQGNPMMRSGGQPPMQIYRQMAELFEIKPVATTAYEIPKDINVLMLVHPKKMPARTQYAIDQFVLRGGRLLVFVDPICEDDVPPGINPMQAMSIPKDSELNRLLNAWGVEMVAGKIAGDREAAIKVGVGQQSRPEAVDYVCWLDLGPKSRSADDPVTGQLTQSVRLATSGILTRKDGATTEFAPLLHTSTTSMAIDSSQLSFMPDPKKLLADFNSEGKELTLAGRITGKVKTAFPDGFPPPDPGSKEDDKTPPPATPPIAESADPISIIVVADCDMLFDKFWIQEERLGPISLGWRKTADNGDLVIGALDNLSGSSDLQSLRARGKFARPFERVQQIQRDAEQQYQARENDLQKKLRDTEQEIAELQRERTDASGKEALILTPEQQAQIEKFRAQMVDTRKELRNVQHQLRQDIERLGVKLRVINMGLMPVLVGLAAVSLAAFRTARRRSERRSVGATD